ncbi:hypothetical protein RW1_051_00460 [Rhodococcus wratislaviensis NBRC 100605]|uniref:Uncharacterized protein n=1 Tax=Rhodococcus wratislaviensis NBRC 100605 TaxID=1219028 RepID=X0Q9L7_RHOWR|nr:hypothetical protein RW1_051_00460 [Rhodococcus wratislaviensis NBRC 100605]
MRKLAIVVNCTERKSVAPDASLQARSLPAGDVGLRFSAWKSRVTTAGDLVPLADLYQGEAWVQARLLHRECMAAGFAASLMVASAGLGLRSVSQMGPAYAATFSGGHADTVASGTSARRAWWSALRGLDDAQTLTSIAAPSVLLVLSENYARAMDDDLVGLAHGGRDVLLVGGARDIDGLPRIPADRALRASLGGTASSIGHRMARAWVARRTSKSLFDKRDLSGFSAWQSRVRKVEVYERQPVTDVELRQLIVPLLANDASLSATRALRHLRDAGIACEQKRFRQIFLTVSEESA